MSNTLHKSQRLKSRKTIDALFKTGRSFSIFPFRIIYLLETKTVAELKAGFSAPSKNFKKAVDRNRIKRLTKESYRINRLQLEETVQALNIKLNIFLIYIGKEIPDQQLVTEKITTGLQQLIKKLHESFS